MTKLRIRLDEAWASYWRLWSVRFKAVGLALGPVAASVGDVWGNMPPDLRHLLPYAQWLAYGMFAMSLFAQLVKQPAAAEKIAAKREAKTNG
ncbi:hypothetical protein [Novosphingobium sp. 9]|uniref:DUF7940 domain-containing protein n=1 Tax=Novosphingobium sp. 9 TaxID=2025349 RepID=UPI0021B57CA0|nr:hypothetical protein [Novosphingobium sp. 9]